MAFGGSIRFAKAFVEVGLDATEAQKSLRKFRNSFRSMRRIGIGVGAGITAGLTPVVAMLTKATQQAALFEETISRFNQEFGKMAPQMRRFTDELVNGLSQSRQQVTDMMSGFNSMLRRGGAENAAKLSQTLSKLAIDMGSFFNRETVDVQRDLMSMLAGSSEVMEKYGVNVKMAAVNQELLNNSIDPKSASEYQKTLARINITMRETAAAQGDAARTQGSLTNQWRAAQNQIQNALIEVGQELIPAVTQSLKDLNVALRAMRPLLGDVAQISGQMAKEVSGRGEGLLNPFSERGRLMRAQGARRTYGSFGRLFNMLEGTAMMSDEQINRRLADLNRGRGSRNRNPVQPSEIQDVQTPDVPTLGNGSQGFLGRAMANLGESAGFRGRAMLRGMTRQFGPQITDAKRALRAQIRGMKQASDDRAQIPKSSHETFSQVAFGGDFQRSNQGVMDVQKQLLDVNTEMLDYIKNNSVVFG